MNKTSSRDNIVISPLNKSLERFFGRAWRLALRDPAQAYFFLRTVRWQRQAARRRSAMAEQGVPVPPVIIYSITDRCNLRCKGCFARELRPTAENEMTPEKMRDTIRQARELGVSFMALAGGEPLVRPEIFDIIRDYQDVIFFVFTNGTLIDGAMADRMKKIRNLVPVISLEGHREETDARRGDGIYRHLTGVIRRLKSRGIFFGTCMTVTRANFDIVTASRFIRELNDLGCRFFAFVEYTPIAPGTEDWVITEEQRDALFYIMKSFRDSFPALFLSVPGDEKGFGGCLSSGRGFVHINARGDIEPCPFIPYSDANLRDASLREALQSPLLAAVRANSDKLEEGQGGCALWKQRDWLAGLANGEPEEAGELVGAARR
jgi:MoaA/NifB/PqqE/SkfB family radical SAM enzyme